MGKRRSLSKLVNSARTRRAGFALAPILYMLGLIGVTAGVLFSGYSQVIRSNIAISDSIAIKNDLTSATQTLAAASVLGTDALTLCPPQGGSATPTCSTAPTKMVPLASLAGDTKLPAGTAAAIAGGPKEIGAFSAASGIKPVDPWGHYYIYCRFESSVAGNASITVISAGADGTIQTPCGATKALGDDVIYAMTVSQVQTASAIWQSAPLGTNQSKVYFGQTGHQLEVHSTGDLLVPGASTLTGAVTIGSGAVATGSLLTVGVAVGSQLTVDTGGDLAVPGTSLLTGVVTTTGAANIGGNLTGASGGTLNIGAGSAVNGNVGIGTTTAPTYSLDIAGSTIRLYGSNSSPPNSTNPAFIVEDSSVATLAISANSASNSSKLLFDASNNNVATLINGSEIARTTATGIGIGTTTPKSKLDIAGGLTVGATYAGTIGIVAPANGALFQGSVGIGNYTPLSALDISGGLAVGANYAGVTAAPTNGASFQGGVAVGTSVIGPYNPNLEVVGSGGLSVEPSDFSGASQYSYLKLTKAGGSYGNPATIQAGDGHTYDTILLNPLGGGVGIGTSSASSALVVGGTVTATTFAGNVPVADLAAGSNASPTTYWRGDNTWASLSLGTAGGITGILPIINGGTNASTEAGALNNLFNGDTGGTSNTLNITRFPAIGAATYGPYTTVYIDATGRVVPSSSSDTPIACTAPAPSTFSFRDQTGVGLNTTITSNAVTLSGFAGCTATATCAGCINILRNGVSDGPSANFINGDTIALQVTSSPTTNTTVQATATVGSTTSSIWHVTTGTNTPNAFSFTNQTGLADSITAISNYVTLTGTFSGVTATCNAGCTGIIYNGNLYYPSVSGLSTGASIAIEQTSAGTNNTATTATVTVGGTTSGTWQVTTGTDACAALSPSVGTACADGSVYAGLTPDGGVKMFVEPCDAGMTGSAGACTGVRITDAWSAGATIATGETNANTGSANTYNLHSDDSNVDHPYTAADYCFNLNYLGHTDWYLPASAELNVIQSNYSAIGGFVSTSAYYWSSTESSATSAIISSATTSGVVLAKTGVEYVRCARNNNTKTAGAANAFSFSNLTNVAVGETITSNTIVLSGPFANLTATCGTGCTAMSINSGPFTAGPVSGINSGATIAIQQVSSSSFNTMTSATVSVGYTSSSPWQVTTATANGCTGSSTPVGTVCSDGSIYAGISPDYNANMYTTPCTYGRSSIAGSPCAGSATLLSWSARGSVATGVTSATTGRANTYQLHGDDGNADHPYGAADACYNLNALGHTDWYLPAINELTVLYTNTVPIGDFISGAYDFYGTCYNCYLSSTENNTSQAKALPVDGISNKTTAEYVRCVRNDGGAVSGLPTAFSFTNQSSVAVGEPTTSNTITLGGPFTNLTATCGTGCIAMSINGGAFTAGPVNGINTGATIAIQQTSSGSLNTMTSATVSVGGTTSSPWQVTTVAANGCAGSPPIGTVCSDGSVYAGLTPDGNVKMYVTPCDAGMLMVTGSCTGSRVAPQWSAGTSIATGETSATQGRENTYALHNDDYNADAPYSAADYCYSLNYLGHTDWYLPASTEFSQIYSNQVIIGGMTGFGNWYWTSTEVNSSQACMWNGGCNSFGKNTSIDLRCARNDGGGVNGSPNAFNFTNQTSSPINETITSNTITLSGPFVNATVTCGTGCTGISINGGAFTAGPVSGVNSGQTLTIRQTSSTSYSTSTTATVTVGSTTSPAWQVTTISANACSGSPAIGTVCADGTVYAGLTPDGGSKMYVTPCDYPMTGFSGACVGTPLGEQWSAGTSVTTGITSANTGRANTYSLHFDDGNLDSPYSAADACYNLNMYGHTDWYLPAYNELSAIMPNYVAITGFTTGWLYWSSTESGNTVGADYVQPGNSSGNWDWKTSGRSIRCARNDGTVTPGAPNTFSFTNQSGVPLGQTITSNTIALSGPFSNATATCGTGCTGISINGAVMVAGPVTGVRSGNTITIQQASSASLGTATTASVTVGSTTSSTWQVTTPSADPCSGSPAVGTYCADGTVYAGITPDGSVKMYATPCDAGETYAGGTCTGVSINYQWSVGQSVSTSVTNFTTGRLNTLALHGLDGDVDGPYSAADYCYLLSYAGHADWYLPAFNELNVMEVNAGTIGNFSGNYWNSSEGSAANAYYQGLPGGGTGNQTGKGNTGVHTRCVRNVNSAPANVPNAFSFTNQTNVAPNILATSNAVTLGGTFAGLTATCGSGCTGIAINGSTTFAPGPVCCVSSGNTITIQQTSSASVNTATTATVTVGTTTSSAWQVTTAATLHTGYFVLSGSTYNGNLGGITGASAKCVTDLTTNTSWQGYAAANSRGLLNSSHIFAFICSQGTNTCNSLSPSTTYYFGNASNASYGGAYFTTDSSGQGPNDNSMWSGSSYFGVNAQFWTAHYNNSTSSWSNSGGKDSCPAGGNWSSSSSGSNGCAGMTAATDYYRWCDGSGTWNSVTCNTALNLVCFVNP